MGLPAAVSADAGPMLLHSLQNQLPAISAQPACAAAGRTDAGCMISTS